MVGNLPFQLRVTAVQLWRRRRCCAAQHPPSPIRPQRNKTTQASFERGSEPPGVGHSEHGFGSECWHWAISRTSGGASVQKTSSVQNRYKHFKNQNVQKRTQNRTVPHTTATIRPPISCHQPTVNNPENRVLSLATAHMLKSLLKKLFNTSRVWPRRPEIASSRSRPNPIAVVFSSSHTCLFFKLCNHLCRPSSSVLSPLRVPPHPRE